VVLNQSEYYVSKLPAERKNGWTYSELRNAKI